MKPGLVFALLAGAAAVAGSAPQAQAATCTISALPNGVSGQAPDTAVTCDGVSGFIFIKEVAPAQRVAGTPFTPANDLTVYANTNETAFGSSSNSVVLNIKGAASTPSCSFNGQVQLMTAAVPSDTGAPCQSRICTAKVICQTSDGARSGRVTHLPLDDGTCPDDPATYVADKVLSSQPVAAPPAADTTQNLPADGSPNCAYSSVSLLKGNIPGCGAVTLCSPKFTCSKYDQTNVIKGVGIKTFDIYGACGLDPSAQPGSPTGGCFADANKCANDSRVTFTAAVMHGAAGGAPAAGSTPATTVAPVR